MIQLLNLLAGYLSFDFLKPQGQKWYISQWVSAQGVLFTVVIFSARNDKLSSSKNTFFVKIPLLSLYEISEKLPATTILGNYVKK